MNPTTGGRLKEKREKFGITQTQLAQHLKVGQSYIAQIENGIRLPSVGMLVDILLYLDSSRKEALEISRQYATERFIELRKLEDAINDNFSDK